jgi:hypothetical protein
VLVRDGLCDTTQTATVDCTSGIERYVWSGDGRSGFWSAEFDLEAA